MGNTVFTDAAQARKSLTDNKFAYTKWVKGEGAKTADNPRTDAFLDGYAQIAAFLCNPGLFEAALDQISSQLWDAYCLFNVDTRNRFTRALNKVAAAKGFLYQNQFTLDTTHSKPIGIKLTGADPQLGHMLRNKLFWKDSMDLEHGEHSHSLQWLAIAQGIVTEQKNSPKIAELYAETGNFRARPKHEKTERSLLMWQWVADCFPTSLSSLATSTFVNGETLQSQSYRSPQVITDYLLNRRGGPIPGHFVSNYLFHRYKNRKWLTTKEVWDEGEGAMRTELDDIYTGSASADRWNRSAANSWQPSPTVPKVRFIRDPSKYVGKHAGSPVQNSPVTFHGKPGALTFYYAE